MKDSQGNEYIWQGQAEVWPRHAPVLFPIVGRLKHDTYSYQGRAFTLAQHGFARDMDFTLKSAAAAACVFELESDASTRALYPFEFRLQTAYALEKRSLTITHRVENRSKGLMPFSLGAHPGFMCPVGTQDAFEDHFLQFEGQDYELWELEGGLRSGKTRWLHVSNGRLPLTSDLFDRDALVFGREQIQKIQLCSAKGPLVSLDCTGWPWFGVWSKKRNTQFICLEPWFGVADAGSSSGRLEDKEEMLHLAAGETFSCSYRLTFHEVC